MKSSLHAGVRVCLCGSDVHLIGKHTLNCLKANCEGSKIRGQEKIAFNGTKAFF